MKIIHFASNFIEVFTKGLIKISQHFSILNNAKQAQG